MKQLLILLLLLFPSFLFAYTQEEIDAANILADREVIVYQENVGNYRLDDTITRKEFMKVFVKIIGLHVESNCSFSFQDIVDDWGCKYIEWALAQGYIAANTFFRPNDQITKAESMKLILKARSIARIENSGDWRYDDMRTAYRKGIISKEYTDYDTYATRGWIFAVAATSTSSTGGGTSSSGGEIGEIDIYDDDWRNMVP